MNRNAHLLLNPLLEDEFNSIGPHSLVYIQDPTHVGTKMRNRLLKASICLPFGNKTVSLTHLKILLANVPKDIHGLVQSDISPDDRQNFKSLEKIMEDRVLNSLKKYVIGSEATIVYLKICKKVTSSSLDTKLNPIERIYNIWNAVFILRIWYNFIKKSNIFSVDNNFISQNAHNCIELNAIGITQLIVKLRNSGSSEMFAPHLFDSQPCERTFRQLRSLGTINFTKINFTLFELLHLVSRIELQNDIVYDKLFNIIDFPRMSKHASLNPQVLPPNDEIVKIIKKALLDAIQTTVEFGMSSEESHDLSQFIVCPLKKMTNPKHRIAHKNENIDEGTEENPLEGSEDEDSFTNRCDLGCSNIHLRDYNSLEHNHNIRIDEDSKYIQIFESDGTSKLVLKSSIVWLLSETTSKLSSDRLKRDQTTPLEKVIVRGNAKRKKKNQQSETSQDESEYRPPNVYLNLNEIAVGDWCFFNLDLNAIHVNIASKIPKENIIENVVFGCILAFKLINGKNEKDKQYHHDKAVTYDVNENTKIKREDLDVLSSWNVINTKGELISLHLVSSFFLNIKNYLASLVEPRTIDGQLKIDVSLISKLK